jgi:hydrogenase expression/formation protein HypD
VSAPLVATAEVAAVRELAAELAAITTRPWTLMEVCGGQTHAFVRWGLDQLLPQGCG